LLDRVGRGDLAHQHEELLRGERLRGDGPIRAVLAQRGGRVLLQLQRLRAVAHQHGEKAIELRH